MAELPGSSPIFSATPPIAANVRPSVAGAKFPCNRCCTSESPGHWAPEPAGPCGARLGVGRLLTIRSSRPGSPRGCGPGNPRSARAPAPQRPRAGRPQGLRSKGRERRVVLRIHYSTSLTLQEPCFVLFLCSFSFFPWFLGVGRQEETQRKISHRFSLCQTRLRGTPSSGEIVQARRMDL